MADWNEAQLAAIARAEARAAGEADRSILDKAKGVYNTAGNYFDGMLAAGAQGLTFGYSDEIDARINAMQPKWMDGSDYTYEQELAIRRGEHGAFEEKHPVASTIAEMGGVAVPSVLTGGATAAATGGGLTLRALIAAGLMGGAETVLYNAGKGREGERLNDWEKSFGTGAALGAAGYTAANLLGKVISYAGSKFGKTGGAAVTRELERLQTQTGKPAEEIVQDVVEGRLMVENKTLGAAIRGSMYSTGGAPSVKLKAELPKRAVSTRNAAVTELQRGLAGADGNVRKIVQETDDQAKAIVGAMYKKFNTPANATLMDAAQDALERVPSAADEINTAYRAATGLPTKLVTFNDAGKAVFNADPTVEGLEKVRRAVSNATSKAFKAGDTLSGEAISEVEKALRTNLDQVGDLAATRATASMRLAAKDAYAAGQKLGSGVEALELEFAKATAKGPEAVEAFRRGAMAQIKKLMGSNRANNAVRNLANENTSDGKLLRLIFPPEQIDDVLRSLDIASDAGEAASVILGGSPTMANAAEAARSGAGKLVDTTKAVMNADVAGMARAVIGLSGRFDVLTGAQKMKVLDVLMSSNPAVLQKALVDGPAAERLINQTLQAVGIGASVPASGLLSQ